MPKEKDKKKAPAKSKPSARVLKDSEVNKVSGGIIFVGGDPKMFKGKF